MDDTLTPISREEFERILYVSLAACRARKQVRGTYTDTHNAKALAESLWQGGMRPYKAPGLEAPPASRYFGHG